MTTDEWRARVDNRLGTIESELHTMKTSEAVAKVRHETVTSRLDKIEGSLTWVVRLLIGGIISALLLAITSGLLVI